MVTLFECGSEKGQAIVSRGRVGFHVDVEGICLAVITSDSSSVSLKLSTFPAVYNFIMQHYIYVYLSQSPF